MVGWLQKVKKNPLHCTELHYIVQSWQRRYHKDMQSGETGDTEDLGIHICTRLISQLLALKNKMPKCSVFNTTIYLPQKSSTAWVMLSQVIVQISHVTGFVMAHLSVCDCLLTWLVDGQLSIGLWCQILLQPSWT